MKIPKNSKANKGFTVIELLIVLVIGFIILVIIGQAVMAFTGKAPTVSYGVGGMIETRCVDGYKVNISNNHIQQMLDENGHGIRCTN